MLSQFSLVNEYTHGREIKRERIFHANLVLFQKTNPFLNPLYLQLNSVWNTVSGACPDVFVHDKSQDRTAEVELSSMASFNDEQDGSRSRTLVWSGGTPNPRYMGCTNEGPAGYHWACTSLWSSFIMNEWIKLMFRALWHFTSCTTIPRHSIICFSFLLFLFSTEWTTVIWDMSCRVTLW